MTQKQVDEIAVKSYPRRKYLSTLASAGLIGVAGCTTENEKSPQMISTEPSESEQGGYQTPTPTPRPEPDSTETECGYIDIPTIQRYWNVSEGDWKFEEDYIQQDSTEINRTVFAENIQITDGEFSAEIESLDGQRGHHITWRSDGRHRSNYYFFGAILNRPPTPRNFYKWGYFKNGTPHNVGNVPFEAAPVKIEQGESHTFRVRFVGDTHEMLVDDKLVFSVRNNDHESGTLGLHCGGRTRFKNIRYKHL